MKQAPSATQAGRPAPLLLVEDTQSLQVLYRSVLVRAGHEVASATTASDALRLFAQSEINIVLLDLVLPDRDGLSLMKDMLDLRPDTAVIVMTAHGSVGRAVEAMRAGAHEFLVKPFDEARLLSAVANVPGGPVPYFARRQDGSVWGSVRTERSSFRRKTIATRPQSA